MEENRGSKAPAMHQIPPYIGDDAFKKFLEEHDCRTGFETVRMRFLGAMAGPGRDADIYPLVEEYEEILEAASRADDPVAFVGKEGMKPFTDTIGVLSQWHGFSEEYPRKKSEAEHAERQPIQPTQMTNAVSNPYRNVGRNDPCPCGSGKKFRKCCLH